MTTAADPITEYRSWAVEEFRLEEEPYYVPVSDEVEIFQAAWNNKLPVLLKGPTGCGKTRFIEYMAYHLNRPTSVMRDGHVEIEQETNLPLVTVACHEDLTASDLVGRYLLERNETVWIDGPLTRAVKAGAICYLDEVVEARKDTTVLIHPLTDHRRILPVEKKSQLLQARDGFLLVISFNPGYQSALKDLKQSTRQRFVAIEFDYPPREVEAEIVRHEGRMQPRARAEPGQDGREDSQPARARPGRRRQHPTADLRRPDDHAGHLTRRACQVSIVWPLTDDGEIQRSIEEVVSSIFEE